MSAAILNTKVLQKLIQGTETRIRYTNGFKGLNLIDRVPEELWTEFPDTVHEAVSKTIPRKKKCKEANCCLRSPYK